MSQTEYLVIAVIVAAGFLRGAVGFGDALLAMPLLAFLIPTSHAATLVALTGLLIAMVILIREWKHVEFRTTFVLTGCGLAAVPAGVWFLRFGNELVIQSILSVVVMA